MTFRKVLPFSILSLALFASAPSLSVMADSVPPTSRNSLKLVAPGPLASPLPNGVSGMLSDTSSPDAAPQPRPSPLQIGASCMDTVGNTIQPSDVRYGRCVADAQTHGPQPLSATASHASIGVRLGD